MPDQLSQDLKSLQIDRSRRAPGGGSRRWVWLGVMALVAILAAAAIAFLPDKLGYSSLGAKPRQVEVAIPASDTLEMAWLASTVFGLSPRELRTLLRQRVFAGEMPEPRTLSSSQECLDFARQSRGGLCVSEESAAASRAANVGALTMGE